MAMGRPRRKLRWVKFDIDRLLMGTTREELPPAERSVWYDLILLAGQADDNGEIIPTIESLPRILNTPENVVKSALNLCERFGKIERNEDTIRLLNYEKYQPTRRELDSYSDGGSGVSERSAPNGAKRQQRRGEKSREEERREEKKREGKKTRTRKSKSSWLTPKHQPRGELQLVMLTDEEVARIIEECGDDGYKAMVRKLEGHLFEHPQYAWCHGNVMIRGWVREWWDEKPSSKKKEPEEEIEYYGYGPPSTN